MTDAFDPRIVRLTIATPQVAASGVGPTGTNTQVYEGLDIRATGTIFSSCTMNQATIKVSNLTKDQRNSILTTARPFIPLNGAPRTPIQVYLDVGRKSTGTFRLFEGNCWASNVTSPPDIGITLESLTNSFQTSAVDTLTFSGLTKLSTIAAAIASKYGWKLTPNPLTIDKQIANFSYIGSSQIAIKKLGEIGNVNAFLNNGVLHVIEKGAFVGHMAPITAHNGMVGIPQACESGVSVRTLIRPDIHIGGAFKLTSNVNPAVNGDWIIKQLKFELASRDDPFWYTILGINTLQTNVGAG